MSSRSPRSGVLSSGTDAAGVDEDQAWSSEALCSSRQAPDALTYISHSQSGRGMERDRGMRVEVGVGSAGREKERERESERGRVRMIERLESRQTGGAARFSK